MPAPAVLVQVADAVVALLNTVPTPFSQSFTAKRKWPTDRLPLDKIGPLRVEVVPSSHYESELEAQDSENLGCRLLVVLRRKFGQQDRAEGGAEGRPVTDEAIDALVLLVEEICAYLAKQASRVLETTGGVEFAAYDRVLIQNTYIHDHLRDNQQFTSIIRVDYGSTLGL